MGVPCFLILHANVSFRTSLGSIRVATFHVNSADLDLDATRSPPLAIRLFFHLGALALALDQFAAQAISD